MAFIFNGSTVTFTPAVGEIRSATFDEGARDVETTSSGDSAAVYEPGTIDATCTVEINGGTLASVGDSNTMTVTWNDGSSTTLGTGYCSGISMTGSTDNPITTTLTFKKKRV